ncbi:glycerophosphodiester phosphodiesterase [Paenibacillus sp. N1-5-1-14]|uniref:glycerophosphodiester phosphodiesterase n=1 Tax=Paenibacillus radicibacter TaxID=2972488 RepID=UPI002159370B|nr:glycerophosphodiester phosphodiesterase [Paenibacillus radicibacter]MCR8643840.1 glycerophosphodiester phosphodiesterase [Paenibacillus radicibacter]
MTNSEFLIMAHRGSMGHAPENTLAAFQLGVEQGCNAIELDIHLSKDGEIVVIHDETLERTTNLTGYVNDYTAAELKQADAGSWFHEKYAAECIPLLEEVLDLVSTDFLLNIEIKHSYNGQLEPTLIELLKRKNRMESVVLSSFNLKSLKAIKLAEPDIRIGIIYNVNVVQHREFANLMGVPVYSLHPNFHNIDPEDVLDAVSSGIQVFPYTINDAEHMKLAISCGVSGIITNYPDRLRSILSGE